MIVVDAIEGVCTQTLTVLQQAFQEGLRPILIINKIDRLILHLKQTPLMAYHHLRSIIEKVNAYISSLYTAEVIRNTATTVLFAFALYHSPMSLIVKRKSNSSFLPTIVRSYSLVLFMVKCFDPLRLDRVVF